VQRSASRARGALSAGRRQFQPDSWRMFTGQGHQQNPLNGPPVVVTARAAPERLVGTGYVSAEAFPILNLGGSGMIG